MYMPARLAGFELVAKTDLELLHSLPLPPKRWDFRRTCNTGSMQPEGFMHVRQAVYQGNYVQSRTLWPSVTAAEGRWTRLLSWHYSSFYPLQEPVALSKAVWTQPLGVGWAGVLVPRGRQAPKGVSGSSFPSSPAPIRGGGIQKPSRTCLYLISWRKEHVKNISTF